MAAKDLKIVEESEEERERLAVPPACCLCGVRSDLGFGETKDDVKPYCLPCFEQHFPEHIEEQQEAFKMTEEYFAAKSRH